MKRRASITIAIFLVISLIPAQHAIAEEIQPNDFDGFWRGSGKVKQNSRCSGAREIPIFFEVKDGLAKSLIQNERLMFETKVKKKGKMTFIYKNAASGSYQTSGQPIDVRFTGKLGMSSGKGSFSFGSGSGCRGSWTATKLY
jgi:hypothetical protein